MRSVLSNYSHKISHTFIFVAIPIFSFFLTFKAGERGFFAFDQSIVFDGGYRILSGQIPYKDFIIPVGPMAFWLQAIFFKVLGVNYFSYIFTAAFINVLSTISSVIIIRLLFPSYRLLSYIAGLLTAIWFYPPFGTPWLEQTAFFFSLLAITILLFTQLSQKNYSIINSLLLLLSGCFACLSILSKQNAGLYILPLYFLLLIAVCFPDLRLISYSCAMFFAGFIASLLVFVLWLWIRSDLKIFFQHVIYIPSLLGVYRFIEEKTDLLRIFLGGPCHYTHLHLLPAGIRFILLFAFAVAIFVVILYIRSYKKIGYSWRRQLLACILCIYIILFQYLFIHTTMNQAENGIPFIGIIFAICIALLLHLYNAGLFGIKSIYSKSRFINKLILVTAASFLFFYVSMLGIKISLSRKVTEFTNSKFPKNFAVDKLKALKWGRPTRAGETDVKEEDIVNLFEYLKAENSNFFVFPNFTLFYGLLNVPSPQPLLWFHKGLTYHVLYNPSLDKWVVDDLKKNMVKIIILEDKPAYNYYLLNDFPQMKSYINDNFVKTKQLGIFNIYEKTNPRIL